LFGNGAPAMLIQFARKGSFIAMDSALKLYEIVITEERVPGGNPGITPQQFLRTTDGNPVNRKSKGHYVIMPSGRMLRSNDPCCL
jgi:hypothetical protein